MKKKNDKGFVLAETLVVTIFIATVLIFLFIQFSNLNRSYDDSFKYNSVEGLYALEDIKEYLLTDSVALETIKKELKINNYVDIGDCSMFLDEDYCTTLLELENIETLIIANNLDDYDNLISEGEQQNYTKNICTIIKGDLDSIGSQVKCGSEYFYVMPDHETASFGTVSLLAKYNLNVGKYLAPGEEGIQNRLSSGYNFIYNEEENYYNYYVNCYEGNVDEKTCNHYYGEVTFLPDGTEYDDRYYLYKEDNEFVYDSRSSLYQYVENYKTELTKIGVNYKEITLPDYNQIIEFGCVGDVAYTCEGAPAWLWSTSYWLGSVNENSDPSQYHIWYISKHPKNPNGMLDDEGGTVNLSKGVRPLVIIEESEIDINYTSTSTYSKNFINFLSKINMKSSEPYRIIASFKNDTYATIRFGDEYE